MAFWAATLESSPVLWLSNSWYFGQLTRMKYSPVLWFRPTAGTLVSWPEWNIHLFFDCPTAGILASWPEWNIHLFFDCSTACTCYFGQLTRMKYSPVLWLSNSWYFGQLTRMKYSPVLWLFNSVYLLLWSVDQNEIFTCSLIVQQLVFWPVDQNEIFTCSLIVQQRVLVTLASWPEWNIHLFFDCPTAGTLASWPEWNIHLFFDCSTACTCYFGQLTRMKYSPVLWLSNSWYFGQLTRMKYSPVLCFCPKAGTLVSWPEWNVRPFFDCPTAGTLVSWSEWNIHVLWLCPTAGTLVSWPERRQSEHWSQLLLWLEAFWSGKVKRVQVSVDIVLVENLTFHAVSVCCPF